MRYRYRLTHPKIAHALLLQASVSAEDHAFSCANPELLQPAANEQGLQGKPDGHGALVFFRC